VAVGEHPRVATPRRPFCAAVSSARREPLAATASRIDHWLLVEYRGPWRRDVLGESLLSPALKAHLREQLAALPHSRLLFVRQPERRSEGRRRVVVGRSRPGEERFLALDVEHHDDLREVDLAGALAGDGAPGVPLEGPLFVVCTHGKRDRCCARQGRPLYDALRRSAPGAQVWQSTHVGGDRFAGNVVVLPHGLYFGRVGPEDVDPLLAALASGMVDLARYRGRSAYSFPVQAAEQAIRESESLLGIDDLALVGSKRLGADRWRVGFRTPDDAVHELDVEAVPGDEPVYLTCEAAEPRHARHHHVTAHRARGRR
jgi:hypothetical protein